MANLKILLWCAVSSKAQSDEDKASLPEQERAGREFVERIGGVLVDVLRVPGHSRRYYTIAECAADMRAAGIDAFDRLMLHLNARDFDVFWCRDVDRFGREQSLLNEVVTRIIDSGARLHVQSMGWIDTGNFRTVNAMMGFTAATEIDQLIRRTKIGKDGRAKRGLSANGIIASSHRPVRDPQTGKITGVELVEERTQEWQDLATLLLEGVPYYQLGIEMFTRFGYSHRGKPRPGTYYQKLLYTPSFWGHTARYASHAYAPWTFLDDEPVPPGVIMVRHSHEPVYKDDQAAAVQAELLRRRTVRGRTRPASPHRLSGLVICAHCRRPMSYIIRPRVTVPDAHYLYCLTRYTAPGQYDCPGVGRALEKRLIEQITPFLDGVRQRGRLILESPEEETGLQQEAELARLAADQERLESQIRALIVKQVSAPGVVSTLYDEQIAERGHELEALKARRFALETRAQARANPAQQEAIADLQAISVEEFWSGDTRAVNQLLHRLLGNLRFVVQNGRIIDIKPADPDRRYGKSNT